MLVVFYLGLLEAEAIVVFNDGGTHTIGWSIYDSVSVKNSSLSQPTTLNLVTGGLISFNLYAYDSSQANISGGNIGLQLRAYDSSQVNISGGSISYNLVATQNSQVSISGGSIGDSLYAFHSSQVSISGGSIGNSLYVYDSSQVTIDGSGFNYPYGDITDSGILTGTLANGDPINNYFYTVFFGRIVLIPEPSTLFLLGLGVVRVRKRRG